MKDSRYFTPGELAKLFGISKQLPVSYTHLTLPTKA